jgi:hypothetical protein
MLGNLAEVIIQIYGYGITREDAICANIAHSMPSGQPMTSSMHKVATVFLINYTGWPTSIMFLFHSALLCSYDIFRDWFYLNIARGNGATKHFIGSLPWSFLTLTVASSVGITDIYMLLVLGTIAIWAEIFMGLMEWTNAMKIKQQEETIVKMHIMFVKHNKSIENIYDTFEDPDGIAANWWEATLDRLIISRVDWIHLWSCILAHSIVVSVILGYYGHMLAKNTQEFQSWIFGAVVAYIAIIALQIFQTFRYWSGKWAPISYAYTEYAHLVLRFVTWTLITFFVLAGGGGNSNAVADGCLYPLA